MSHRLKPRPMFRFNFSDPAEPLYPRAVRECADMVWRSEIENPPTAAEWLSRLRRSARDHRRWGKRGLMKWPPRPWIRPPEDLSYGWMCWVDPARLP